MVLVAYKSNNSGGGWWLTDQSWKDLEAAGWKVDWVANQRRDYFKADKDGRWLGALATEASKEFSTLGEGIREWEQITGESSNDLGCSCCGTPHSFSADNGEFYSPDYPMAGEPYDG